MNCTKTLELIKQSQELHTQALAQIQKFSETFSDMRPKNDLNIFTELRKINTQYENLKKQIKANLKEIENLLPFFTYEKYLTDLHPFMLKTYKNKWSYNKDKLETVESVASSPDNIHIDEVIPLDEMKAINVDEAKIEENKSKTGELYLNSEQINFESSKAFIPEIPEDIKKQGISGVMKYIYHTYKDTHILPDIKYYQYITQLSDKYRSETDPIKKEIILKQIPKQLQGGGVYHFPEFVVVHESGRWVFPFLVWGGDNFLLSGHGVESDWNSNDLIVLLER